MYPCLPPFPTLNQSEVCPHNRWNNFMTKAMFDKCHDSNMGNDNDLFVRRYISAA